MVKALQTDGTNEIVMSGRDVAALILSNFSSLSIYKARSMAFSGNTSMVSAPLATRISLRTSLIFPYERVLMEDSEK